MLRILLPIIVAFCSFAAYHSPTYKMVNARYVNRVINPEYKGEYVCDRFDTTGNRYEKCGLLLREGSTKKVEDCQKYGGVHCPPNGPCDGGRTCLLYHFVETNNVTIPICLIENFHQKCILHFKIIPVCYVTVKNPKNPSQIIDIIFDDCDKLKSANFNSIIEIYEYDGHFYQYPSIFTVRNSYLLTIFISLSIYFLYF